MSTAPLPTVSVIIPVWNGADHIGNCLDALGTQSYPSACFEVIVVDNGSSDATRAVVSRYPDVTLLSEPIASSYRARNRGLDHARGEYALFTDADCTPDPDWIAAAVRTADANPKVGIIGGRITLFATEEASPACQTLEELFSFNQEATLAGGHCVTANWLSRRALLLEMGGFDATMRSGGDMEMARRIRARGMELRYAPDMIVSHPIRGSYGELRSKYLRTVGGTWGLKKGARLRVARLLAGQTKNLLWRGALTVKARQVPVTRRLAATAILLRLYLEGLVELTRLAVGGEPRRS